MARITSSSTGAHGVAEVISGMEKPIVFGMPGGHMMQVFDALRDRQDEVRGVLVREESIATVMAEVYGRLTGSPAVVMAQGAWVLGAGGIGIMEAHLGASPVVILIDATEGGSFSHHGPYQGGLGGYGAYDLVAAMTAITKRTFLALDPVQAVQMTQLAVKHAIEGEPGPVAVVFHSEALQEKFSERDLDRIYFDRTYISPVPHVSDSAIAGAATAIQNSKSPIIVAGNGTRGVDSAAALIAFAEALNIPVASTASGKGVFPEDNALAAGVIGSYGHDAANALVGESDLVFAIGTKLGATDTLEESPGLINASRQVIIQVDLEALNIGWTYPVDHALLGNVANVLPRLQAVLAGVDGGGEARVSVARGDHDYFGDPKTSADANTVNPRRLARLLSDHLPADAVVTCDAGENRIFMLHDFQTRRGDTFLQPNGGGGMGYAVPAAVAATYVHPSRMAIAVTGDGGYGMSLHALMTAVENERQLLVVVMDNQALGWVLHGQAQRPFLANFAPFELGNIARAIGCNAIVARTEDEVRAGIAQASESSGGVTVLVVKTSLSESFLTIQTKMAVSSHEEVQA